MNTETESNDSPLRLLVKSYENGLLNREQYLDVRVQLLRKLSSQGSVSHDELKNFLKIYKDTEQPTARKSYSTSDWIIIILGLLAALALAAILYG